MNNSHLQFADVAAYIQSFPPGLQQTLEQIRKIILEHAPGAVEGISYGMPAYKLLGKPLVYFAAFSNHIGFYATPSGHEAFTSQLANYKQGKGSVQFPLNQPLPLELIAKMVQFKVAENKAINKKQPVKKNIP